jgi:hypothetical protein
MDAVVGAPSAEYVFANLDRFLQLPIDHTVVLLLGLVIGTAVGLAAAPAAYQRPRAGRPPSTSAA